MRRFPKPPKNGDLRVWNIKNPPNEPNRYLVESPLHAKQCIDALADSQLLQPQIHSNAFGLEVYEDGEWIEWTDEEGRELGELETSELEELA